MRILAFTFAGLSLFGLLTPPVDAQQRPVPAGTSDVKGILFELANSMGMLRGLQQQDSILTLEHWAKGSMTVGGQRFELPEYRMSINYSVPGMRVDFRRQAAGAQPERIIEVVSGAAAWNETERGMNATPARDRVKERLVYLWTTPMGVVKAAALAGARATIKNAGGPMVLSFPLPAPADDVVVNATLSRDSSLLVPDPAALTTLLGTYIARVQTTGGLVSEATYAGYGDWNWEDYQADIMQPRRITRKLGDISLELTTVNTNTYNPYVIMPVPANVK